MQGFRIHVSTPDDLTDIRFRLYDNDNLVIDNIGTVDFDYLVDKTYTGKHKLDLTYFQTWNTDAESTKHEIFNRNFTLPVLTIITSYEII
jgi:hypothetical protein